MIPIKSVPSKEITMNINTLKRIMKEVDTKRHMMEGRKGVVERLNKQLPISHFPIDQRSIELHRAIVADKNVMDALRVLIEQGVKICINSPAVAPKNIDIDKHGDFVISSGTNLNTIRKYLKLPTS